MKEETISVPTSSGPITSGSPERSTCRHCGATVKLAFPGPPRVVRCSACELQYLEEFPAPEEAEESYQDDYYNEESGARFLGPLEWVVRFFRWLRVRSILRFERGPGSFLDVGCGRGALVEEFQKRGWSAVGTQISRTAARAAERRGVRVLVGELPALGLTPGTFSVVTFFHVLEHLEDPDSYLRSAHELLRPGGVLLVEVPDCGGLGFRLLRHRHLCVDYPHHLFFFSRRTLTSLVERSGFRVVGRSFVSLEYSPFTTLQNMLNVFPGRPNRLYHSLMQNAEGVRLRRSPWTWVHVGMAALLVGPALLLSLLGSVLPLGNTVRFYCRREGGDSGLVGERSPGQRSDTGLGHVSELGEHGGGRRRGLGGTGDGARDGNRAAAGQEQSGGQRGSGNDKAEQNRPQD